MMHGHTYIKVANFVEHTWISKINSRLASYEIPLSPPLNKVYYLLRKTRSLAFILNQSCNPHPAILFSDDKL